jgi:hypothetical protein
VINDGDMEEVIGDEQISVYPSFFVFQIDIFYIVNKSDTSQMLYKQIEQIIR